MVCGQVDAREAEPDNAGCDQQPYDGLEIEHPARAAIRRKGHAFATSTHSNDGNAAASPAGAKFPRGSAHRSLTRWSGECIYEIYRQRRTISNEARVFGPAMNSWSRVREAQPR